MKKSTVMAVIAVVAVMATAGAAFAGPELSGVTMTKIDNIRKMQITYNLAGEDAIITLSIETNGVPIPDSAVTRLSGDVCKKVEPGSRTIIWDAGADWPENKVANARARVTAWPNDAPPLYCAVDLSGGPSATSYPVFYYTSVDALPYGGLSNVIYKTSQLVMRKIDAGTFGMGEDIATAVPVTLTKNFYAGVFQVTQGQWQQVMNAWPSAFKNLDWRAMRPVEMVSWNQIRGGDWPGDPAGTGLPAANTFITKLRDKTGVAGFDLPTEAQWEYACRAGTTGTFNNGDTIVAEAVAEGKLALLGRTKQNGGRVDAADIPTCTVEKGPAAVGSYLPNDWGLYDMHGNMEELCLDWHAVPLPGGIDPLGPGTGTGRAGRSSNYSNSDWASRSAAREARPVGHIRNWLGFRLVMNIAQ